MGRHRRVAALRETVAALPDVDLRARASRLAFVAATRRLARPLDEEADRTHVTASGIVVGHGVVLLHRHRRLGIWMQPGGHLDAGEPPWQAAVREVWEETGLRCAHPGPRPELVHVDVHDAPKGHIHLDVRYLLYASGRPNPPPGESQEVDWFSWDDAMRIADAGLVGGLRRARARVGAGRARARPGEAQ